ncbi:MAG: hypothetical protein R3C03_18100 [Pirellulaceae bacterium]
MAISFSGADHSHTHGGFALNGYKAIRRFLQQAAVWLTVVGLCVQPLMALEPDCRCDVPETVIQAETQAPSCCELKNKVNEARRAARPAAESKVPDAPASKSCCSAKTSQEVTGSNVRRNQNAVVVIRKKTFASVPIVIARLVSPPAKFRQFPSMNLHKMFAFPLRRFPTRCR